MLILPIKKKWFDMILSGEKKEEYREIKPYYDKRFGNYLVGYPIRDFDASVYPHIEFTVLFRNGYSRNSPQIKCKCTLDKGFGKEEWGAEKGKEYYILKIIEVINNE